MKENILLISEEETFTVKGLVLKLTEAGMNVERCPFKIKEIEKYVADAEIFILYTDDELSQHADVLVYIKDVCIELSKNIALIGGRADKQIFDAIFPKEYIINFFARPLDMSFFMEEILNFALDNMEERKKSILVVDDDPVYGRMISNWMKDVYSVSMVTSGLQAIQWLAKNRADLILLDYAMPVTSGPEVLEMLKSEDYTKKIPVMFLTGVSDKESIATALNLGPQSYLLKTINKNGLLQKLRTFFQDK